MNAARSRQLANLCRFGFAHATRSLSWAMVDLLLAWHLHTKLGLTGTQTGWMMFAFLVLGGVATFLVGFTFDRHDMTGTAVVRAQLPATVAAGVLLVMQFQGDSVFAVFAASVCFRIAYAVQDVAQNMLNSLLPDSAADATRYARLRVTLSAVTRCCVVIGFALLTPDRSTGYLISIALAMSVSAWSLRKLEFPLRSEVAVAARSGQQNMPKGLPSLLCAWLIAAAVLPTLQRLLIFAPAIDGYERTGAWLLGGFCIGSVVGPMVRATIDGRLLLVMIAMSGAAMILPIPFVVGGALWPVAGAVVHGIGVSLVGVRLWANTSRVAMMDAGDGRRSDGVVFGSVILTVHLASAAGMVLLGPLIEGFEAGQRNIGMIALTLTVLGAALLAGLVFSEKTAPLTA